MIVTCQTKLKDILHADEFKNYTFNIERVTGIIRLLEYIKMDNKIFEFVLDKDGIMRVDQKDTQHPPFYVAT